jgi:hypothetical protein
MFCAPGPVSGGSEDVRSSFHLLHSRTRFRQYRGRRVPFSCFALPDPFQTEQSAEYSFHVSSVSGLVFMFCDPRVILGGSDGVGSRFQVLRCQTNFLRYLRRRVLFICFSLPDSFSTVPRASCPVFIFCAPGLIFRDTEDVGSYIHDLRSLTHFRR